MTISNLAGMDRLRALLDASRCAVVFTGAGISTESGIPDFRGPQGLWKTIKPTQFQDFVASDATRQQVWRSRFAPPEGDAAVTIPSALARALPNKGHLAVAKLVADGTVARVITQNVDNLHQDSGIDETRVIELHGNATYARCLSCALRYEMADLQQEFLRAQRVGPCRSCGGIIKSATISFGQAMPVDAMARAEAAIAACDLCLVMGSSLVVYPAAGFPELAKRRGAKLVIINNEETPLDDAADLVLRQPIGATLSYVVGIN